MEDFEIYLFSSVIVTLVVYVLACLLHCFDKGSWLETARRQAVDDKGFCYFNDVCCVGKLPSSKPSPASRSGWPARR